MPVAAFGPAVVDRHVTAFDQADLAQALAEPRQQMGERTGRAAVEKADDRQRRGLGAAVPRPAEQGTTQGLEDERTPVLPGPVPGGGFGADFHLVGLHLMFLGSGGAARANVPTPCWQPPQQVRASGWPSSCHCGACRRAPAWQPCRTVASIFPGAVAEAPKPVVRCRDNRADNRHPLATGGGRGRDRLAQSQERCRSPSQKSSPSRSRP